MDSHHEFEVFIDRFGPLLGMIIGYPILYLLAEVFYFGDRKNWENQLKKLNEEKELMQSA